MKTEREINKIEVSNRIFTVAVVFLVGLGLFWTFRMYEIWNQTHGNYPREISVEGEGSSYAVPDVATLYLGVNTEAKTSEAAVEENTEKMNAVIEGLKEFGLEDEDIQTTNYSLSPNYEWTKEKGSVQDGYRVDQSVTVKVRDLGTVGEVMGIATKAGATTMGGLNFEVEDPDTAKAEAREDAIAKAKAKAENIAKQSGLKLGKVLGYYEYENNYGKGGMRMYSESADYDMGAPMAMPEIEPGQEEVTMQVTLTYSVY